MNIECPNCGPAPAALSPAKHDVKITRVDCAHCGKFIKWQGNGAASWKERAVLLLRVVASTPEPTPDQAKGFAAEAEALIGEFR